MNRGVDERESFHAYALRAAGGLKNCIAISQGVGTLRLPCVIWRTLLVRLFYLDQPGFEL
jgi:hypothetical protein